MTTRVPGAYFHSATYRGGPRHYLASGENASTVSADLYVHRNTVNYRVGRAVALLPDGLDGHRTEVGLALDLLTWVPDVVERL